MTTDQMATALRRMRRFLVRPDAGTDIQLLHRFVHQRDESAFELLVWRFGRMVYSVCRRVLRDEHDAEDAFQATMLVLARKANSVCRVEALGGWLYRVAYRVALRARENTARRARHEQRLPTVPDVPDPDRADPAVAELQSVLDEELNRLAEKHRAPVVLCYLEGLTNEEAARRMRCPIGTIKTRLAKARSLLASQLRRRGLALAASIVAGESFCALAATPPANLVALTVRAASAHSGLIPAGVSKEVLSLMEGVLRAMYFAKAKIVTVTLAVCLGVLGTGTGWLQSQTGGSTGAGGGSQQTPSPVERAQKLKKQISELTQELHKAEDEAARLPARPPKDKPLAVIFGNVPITREDLAEELLANVTTSQLESFINRRILEEACKKKGISVTDFEVDAALDKEIADWKLDYKGFQERIRSQFHKSMHEWKEGTIRSRLLLKKLVEQIDPTEKELRAEFDAHYGEKVECDYICWRAEDKTGAGRAAVLLRDGKTTIDELAQQEPRPMMRRTTTVEQRRTKDRAALEQAAFALGAGEISPLIVNPHGCYILKCIRRIPAAPARFEDVRQEVVQLVRKRLSDNIWNVFRDLKTEAHVEILWTPPGVPEAASSLP
ncbi:MAG: sigma-70 family RNA polymerase sigma factor [Planctomycetes bacterium]|nr:sigma-70 family RNA polymerase sigma factor [Planctomycetota bacterium]